MGSFVVDGSARIVVAPVEGLAVEVEVGKAGEAVEGAFLPDFDAVKEDRVVAQFDGKRTQGEVYLQEFFYRG